MSSFAQFITERKYIKNISPATVAWYGDTFKAFEGIDISSAKALRQSIMVRVKEMYDRGVKPISVRSWMTGIRAYGYWLHQEGYLSEKPRIEIPKFTQTLITTFTAEQIKRVINGKPVGRNETRARMAAVVALDTGMRIQELLNLRRADTDLDNLLFRVHGKGDKHRLVPMSIELRKLLFRYLSQHQFDRVFATARGTSPSQRNLSRDFKLFCKRNGIGGVRVSYHTLRHTFSVEYLKAGGNVLYLQRILGHTNLEMTNRYVRSLGIEDLKAVHSGLSLLSR